MRRKFKKLEYKEIIIDGIVLYFSRSYCKTLHLTIKNDNKIYYVVPYFVDEKTIVDFIIKKKNWILKSQNEVKNKINLENITKEDIEKLYEKISSLVKKYESLMNVKVNDFKIRKMKTLWGSCSYKKKTIRFSSMLSKKPNEFIEYVVVHEMCHLFVPNHSREFHQILNKYLPMAKDYEKIGKKNEYSVA